MTARRPPIRPVLAQGLIACLVLSVVRDEFPWGRIKTIRPATGTGTIKLLMQQGPATDTD